MSDGAQVIDYLREQFARVHAKLDRNSEEIRELKYRDGARDIALASIRREVAVLGEAVAHVGVQVDKVIERLDRIERRLDIVEPAGS